MTLGRPSGATFIDNAIREVLARIGVDEVPDLVEVSRVQKVREILFRDLFSDGALEPVRGGFRIYLKSRREYDLLMTDPEPILPTHTRFTLAHELVHTFFYDHTLISSQPGRRPRPLRHRPKPTKLERLCQYGAAALLIPLKFLQREHEQTPNCETFSAHEIYDLSRKLRVSAEAFIRRLDELDRFNPPDSAHLLIERNPTSVARWHIIAARCGDWFSAYFGRPRSRFDLSRWLRQKPSVVQEVVSGQCGQFRVGYEEIRCGVHTNSGNPDRHILECQRVFLWRRGRTRESM